MSSRVVALSRRVRLSLYLAIALLVTLAGVRQLVPVAAARQTAASTVLAVSTASGTYGGTATITANLTSSSTPVAGESVSFYIGSTNLGTAVTNASGNATIPSVSLTGINVGTYIGEVTASFAGDINFDPSSGSNDLTVNPAPLTITADNQTKVYGAAVPILNASYSGFVNGDTTSSLTNLPTLSTSATSSSHVAGSPYSISASGAVDSNYTISYVDGSLSVTTAPLTITADNQTKPYGAALPTLTASYSGFVNGDTSNSLTISPTLTTTATASSHVAGSPYSITASGAVGTDYTISYVPGSLTVTPAPLTITADNQSKGYGAAVPTLTASFTGFVNGDTASSFTTLPTLSTSATAASAVAGSPYSITAGGAVDTDYVISYVAGNISVAPAPLTITVNNQAKVYGAALPTLTTSYSGFVNGDTAANLATLPTLTTTATAASSVAGSPYAITASGAVDTNYAISYVAGSLSITPAPLTITANNQTRAYGIANPTLTAAYTGFTNGDTAASLTGTLTCTTTATPSSPSSPPTYPITCGGLTSTNYAISYVAGALTIGDGVTLTLATTGAGSVAVSPVGVALGSGMTSFAPGTLVTLTPQPQAGAQFIGWAVDGAPAGWANPLAVTLATSHTIQATFAASPAFGDVQGGTAAEAITQLAARGIIKGYADGTFGPADDVARAQMAVLIVRAFGWGGDTPPATAPFTDLGIVDAELQRAVGILAQRGIINGYGNGTFGPTDNVLHIQVISFITRSMIQAGYWTAVTQDDPALYPNVSLASGHRLDLLTYTKYAGAIPDRAAGQNWQDWNTPASRAWTAQVLWQALNSYASVDRVP